MRSVSLCESFKVSCGSIIVETVVSVEQSDNDTAPANQQELLQQLSGILNDTDVGQYFYSAI